MTNGEKMQAVFPDIEMWGESKDTLDYSLGGMIHRVTKSWWNAEYKEPSNSEFPKNSPTETLVSLDVYNQVAKERDIAIEQLHELGYEFGQKIEPTAKNDLGVREFEGIEVTYPPEDICIYPEYKGKPYFGIQYRENGEIIVGYGTYNPQVLSRYLKDYFMPTTKNDLGVDCISRADAIKAMQDKAKKLTNEDTINGLCGAVAILFDLPSVTPQEPRWISVSERLPKAYEFVNCTCHSLIDDREDWVIETCYIPQPHNSPYSDWGNIPMLNSCECEVIAWMRRDIPEPYKAESENV